ncbi:MAG: hypothetical protein HYZ29_25955 [Myxococcales bacterium]|nr:hypothetical protein [Myxococcales bacterium]
MTRADLDAAVEAAKAADFAGGMAYRALLAARKHGTPAEVAAAVAADKAASAARKVAEARYLAAKRAYFATPEGRAEKAAEAAAQTARELAAEAERAARPAPEEIRYTECSRWKYRNED